MNPQGERNPFDDQNIPHRAAVFFKRFKRRYPTQKLAKAELIRQCILAKPPCCDNPKLMFTEGRRQANCSNCKKQIWVTAGTFFANIRNARAWLAGVMLFELGIVISASAFTRYIGCSYSLSWDIFHRLRIIMDRDIDDSMPVLPDTSFIKALRKRSRETPQREHPAEELTASNDEASEDAPPSDNSDSNQTTHQITEMQQKVLDQLSFEPVHCDVLIQRTGLPIGLLMAILTELEIEGLIKAVGAKYVKTAASSSRAKSTPAQISTEFKGTQIPMLNTARGVVSFLISTFHGLSRKYLQLYLAGIWNMAVPGRWGNRGLFRRCVQSEPIKREEILAYVSERYIRIPFGAAPPGETKTA